MTTIAITCGDPGGIGPEIVLSALDKLQPEMSAQVLLVGHTATWRYYRKQLGLTARLPWLEVPDPRLHRNIWLRLWDPEDADSALNVPFPAGKTSLLAGKISFLAVEKAIDLAMQNIVQAIVTAPICKASWQLAGANYPGHTELLAEKTGAKQEVMLLAGEGLRVAVLTTHIPLKDVPKAVKKDKMVKISEVILQSLQNQFGIAEPKLAITGLNPHAGEDGCLGDEEIKEITPAIKELQQRGFLVSGPHPADTVFRAAQNKVYDAVLAMYHDQGLSVLKTVAFDTGVNITLGLPIIRISPDHGTAFDIAGTGKANCESMENAIKLAVQLQQKQLF